MNQGYTYDDVLLTPKKAAVDSRSEADTSASLKGGIDMDIPVISSPMDSVTGSLLAEEMYEAGGVGIIHRFCGIESQVDMVSQVDGIVGAAVGISDDDKYSRAPDLIEHGADFLCVDVAHAHMDSCLEAVEYISSLGNVPVMAGTVATRQATKDLGNAGADIVRVGIGTGSSCTTRVKAGVGVPQITAIREACKNPYDVSIIADGGIKKPGDIVKALMAGADAVIIGGLLGSCEESLAPVVEKNEQEYKKVRGMASKEAQEDYREGNDMYIEGEAYLTPVSGTVKERMEEFEKGIRSGISYCGGTDIQEARNNAEFIRVTDNTVHRNGVHGG